MKIHAAMRENQPEIIEEAYEISEILELSESEYASLYQDLLEDQEYFAQRKSKDDAILILGENQNDGILVQTQNKGFAYKSSFIPEARLIAEHHIRQLADYCISEGTQYSEILSGMDAASFGQNAYFYDAAEGLLTATILLVAEFCKPEQRHIVSVFKIIQELLAPSGKKGKNQFQQLMELLPNDHKAKWFAGAALNTAEQSMASVMSTALSRLNAFLDSELEQILCFDTEIDAEKFCNEKSALFIIMPEENPATFFMISLIIQQLYREILAVADENGGKLKNRCVFFCDEYGTLPKIESAEMMFSASRSRRLQIVPIIQSFSQLEKNYGKEGAEIIVDNTQLTIFGGFAPQSTSAETLSKALGSRTVMSGSVSRSKNDPSESLQMIERPLMTPDELKSMPKGQFVVMKTGFYPMKVKLKLFFKWGIHFDEDHPYTVADQGNREVKYASKKDITDGIIKKYHPELLEPAAPPNDDSFSGGQNQQMTEHHQPALIKKNDEKDKNGGTALQTVPKNRRTPLPQPPKNTEVTSDGQT